MNREAIIKKCPKSVKDNRPDSEQQWCLFDHNGDKLLGRHPSKEKALAQERAIQVHKHGASVTQKYLDRLALMEMRDRTKLAEELKGLAQNVKHLEARLKYFDSSTDPDEAKEVKKELKIAEDRIKEITKIFEEEFQ